MGGKITDAALDAAITAEIEGILREMDPDESLVEFTIRAPVKAAVLLGWLLDRVNIGPADRVKH